MQYLQLFKSSGKLFIEGFAVVSKQVGGKGFNFQTTEIFRLTAAPIFDLEIKICDHVDKLALSFDLCSLYQSTCGKVSMRHLDVV